MEQARRNLANDQSQSLNMKAGELNKWACYATFACEFCLIKIYQIIVLKDKISALIASKETFSAKIVTPFTVPFRSDKPNVNNNFKIKNDKTTLRNSSTKLPVGNLERTFEVSGEARGGLAIKRPKTLIPKFLRQAKNDRVRQF